MGEREKAGRRWWRERKWGREVYVGNSYLIKQQKNYVHVHIHGWEKRTKNNFYICCLSTLSRESPSRSRVILSLIFFTIRSEMLSWTISRLPALHTFMTTNQHQGLHHHTIRLPVVQLFMPHVNNLLIHTHLPCGNPSHRQILKLQWDIPTLVRTLSTIYGCYKKLCNIFPWKQEHFL